MKASPQLFALSLFAAASCAAAAEVQTHLPPVTATAAYTGLREEAPVDETGRPAWTSARRFGSTRVYLQRAPWEVSFEQWVRIRDRRDGTAQIRFQEEIEIGLPYRFQLDI